MYFKLNEGWTQSYILDHAANEQAHDSWALSLEIYTLTSIKKSHFLVYTSDNFILVFKKKKISKPML